MRSDVDAHRRARRGPSDCVLMYISVYMFCKCWRLLRRARALRARSIRQPGQVRALAVERRSCVQCLMIAAPGTKLPLCAAERALRALLGFHTEHAPNWKVLNESRRRTHARTHAQSLEMHFMREVY